MQKTTKHLFLFFLFFLMVFELEGQDTLSIVHDSVFIKKNTTIVYQDTTKIIRKDTLIFLPDTSIIKIKGGPLIRWFNQYLTVEKPIEKPPESEESEIDDDEMYWYNGKRIRNIRIKKLDVFGTSLFDTSWVNDAPLIRFGNKLHIKTNNYVIRNNLLFKKGEKISPLLLRESERILRSRAHIKDARIYAIPLQDDPDKVDILIVEKDVWSITPTFKPRNVDAFDLGINELNLVGMGHELRNTFFFDLSRETEYKLDYRVPTLGKTFTSARLIYSSEVNNKIVDLSLDKDFISSEIRFGGGIGYRLFNGVDTSFVLPETFENSVKHETMDGWLGWSLIRKQDPLAGWQNLIISAGVENQLYLRHPRIVPDSNLQYQDQLLFLASLSYTERNYYRSNYILGYGRTEDVPIGKRVELTAGYGIGEVFNRPYMGISFAHSHRFLKLGYFSNEYRFGGFFRRGDMDQGIVQIHSTYFTPLFGREKRFKHRLFLYLDGTFGINQRNNKIVDIRNRNGIRALRSHQLRGQAKAFINSSYVVFSPWKLLGFRFAFVGNIDVGYVGKNARDLLEQSPYWGLGAIVEATNENLIFGILQAGISYFPNTPDDVSSIGFTVGTRRNLVFRDFAARKPSIIQFGDIIAREE